MLVIRLRWGRGTWHQTGEFAVWESLWKMMSADMRITCCISAISLPRVEAILPSRTLITAHAQDPW